MSSAHIGQGRLYEIHQLDGHAYSVLHITVQAAAPAPVQLRSGITLLPEAAAEDAAPLPLTPGLKPMEQLDRTLCEIGSRYGASRREWVMMELEYPGQPACETI